MQVQNNLEKFEVKDYETTVCNYLEKLSSCTSVKSVLKIGSYAYPGTSDIDLIIILNEKPMHFNEKYSIEKLSKKDQYLFMHEPFIISKDLASQANLLYPFNQSNAIYGSDIKTTQATKHDRIAFIVNEWISGYMQWPTRALAKKQLQARTIIPQISATKHSVAIFKQVFKPNKQFEEKFQTFTKNANLLRENCFNATHKNLEKQIYHLITTSKELHRYMYDVLLTYLKEEIKIRNLKTKIYFGYFPKIILFKAENEKETKVIRTLPLEFYALINPTNCHFQDEKLQAAFKKRKNLLYEYEKFIFENNLEKFMLLHSLHSKIGRLITL